MRVPRRAVPLMASAVVVSAAIAGMLCWHVRSRAHVVPPLPGREPPREWPHPADGRLRPDGDFSAKKTPVTFEGVVVERLKSDGFWCGFSAFYQGIRYRVTRPLEGGIATRSVVVFHGLVGPPLCEAERPELSRAIFRVGARLRIQAERTAKGVLVAWEDPSTVTVLDGP